MKTEKIEFVNLKDGEKIKGVFAGFGKNTYGVFIKILSDKKSKTAKCLSLGTVLKNVIKANLELFEEGKEIEISRIGKQKGKKYIIYDVILENKLLESRNFDLSFDDVKNLL